jgi:hypothetical protein
MKFVKVIGEVVVLLCLFVPDSGNALYTYISAFLEYW